MAYGFTQEALTFDNFQDFELFQTCLRLICSMLLSKTLFADIQSSIKMLQYLKRLKSNRNNMKGRTMNVILCTM